MQRQLTSVVCRSQKTLVALTSRSGRPTAFRFARRLSTSSIRFNEPSDQDGPAIRFYQQEFPWSTSRQELDPDHPFLEPEVASEAKQLKERVATLREELKDMNRRLEDGSILEPFLEKLPTEAQQQYRAAVRDNISREAKKKEAIKALLPRLEISAEVTPMQKHHLNRLNKALKASLEEESTYETRKELGRSYARCRALAPQIIPNISETAWGLLILMSVLLEINRHPRWAAHRIKFYEDMVSTGKQSSSSQKLLYLSALHHEGRQEEAIQEWQDMGHEYAQDPTALAQYEIIGVQLFISQRDPKRAEQIAFGYLERERPEESRILVGILGEWAKRGDEIGLKHAWVLYLKIKAQLGSNITIQSYDDVMVTFLRAGQTDLALAVFKDMMQTGQDSEEESLEIYRKVTGLIAVPQYKAIKVEDINTVALTGLTTFPKRFRNKFFFGCWLKRLIGMGQVDAAAQVIELMRQLGVKPVAKHLNGIIGAWLRSNLEADHEKAERLAWAMIHERLDFVDKRNQHQQRLHQSGLGIEEAPNPLDLRSSVSPATIETFSTLLFYYVNRRKDSYVDLLQRVLCAAEIPPNHYFMNHLLFQDRLKDDYNAMWTRYTTTFSHVSPDTETFECLWDAEKKHLEKLAMNLSDDFPGPRSILSEMVKWFSSQSQSTQQRARGDFNRHLYGQIIRCMCLAKDLEGAIVACHFLRDAYGAYPDAETAEAVTLAIARYGMDAPEAGGPQWRPRRHRVKGNSMLQAKRRHVHQIHEDIWQERSLRLEALGFQSDNMTDNMQNQEHLFIFTAFLRQVIARLNSHMDEPTVEDRIQQAALEMGIGETDFSDPLPSYKIPK